MSENTSRSITIGLDDDGNTFIEFGITDHDDEISASIPVGWELDFNGPCYKKTNGRYRMPLRQYDPLIRSLDNARSELCRTMTLVDARPYVQEIGQAVNAIDAIARKVRKAD